MYLCIVFFNSISLFTFDVYTDKAIGDVATKWKERAAQNDKDKKPDVKS